MGRQTDDATTTRRAVLTASGALTTASIAGCADLVDRGDLVRLWQDGTGREVFYDIDADVHLIDPKFMINRIGWSQDDIDEIEDNVAPFAGNTIFSGSYPWHEGYTYYSLYEAFEKVADLFQLEMTARDLYSGEFGGEQLFDRGRVAEIVTEG